MTKRRRKLSAPSAFILRPCFLPHHWSWTLLRTCRSLLCWAWAYCTRDLDIATSLRCCFRRLVSVDYYVWKVKSNDNDDAVLRSASWPGDGELRGQRIILTGSGSGSGPCCSWPRVSSTRRPEGPGHPRHSAPLHGWGTCQTTGRYAYCAQALMLTS